MGRYEREGRARRTVKAQKLWFAILEAQTETGTPYMLYKDACNRKSNQQNLGTIKSSNLCTEIVEYTSTEEVCCCVCAVSEEVCVTRSYFPCRLPCVIWHPLPCPCLWVQTRPLTSNICLR